MKVKDLEGTPEEIGKICEEQNFSFQDYLSDKPKMPKWLILLIGILFLLVCCILWTVNMSESIQRIAFLIELFLLGLVAVLLHLKYNKWIVTLLASFFGLIMLSVSLNFLTPKEAIDTMKEKIELKSE